MARLVYKILGRRSLRVENMPGSTSTGPTSPGSVPMPPEDWEMVDVEWTCSDGPVQDYHNIPVTHPPIVAGMEPIKYEARPAGKRDVIKDQVNVKAGTSDAVVAMMLEEKKKRLAECLGIKLDA